MHIKDNKVILFLKFWLGFYIVFQSFMVPNKNKNHVDNDVLI